jgi:hypothetical protein
VIGSFGKKLKSYSSVLYPYPPHLAPIEVEILFEKGTWAVAELPFSKRLERKAGKWLIENARAICC